MDDPASILGRAVPVLMTGPVKFGHFQYGDRDLVMFVDGLGMFFFCRVVSRPGLTNGMTGYPGRDCHPVPPPLIPGFPGLRLTYLKVLAWLPRVQHDTRGIIF